MTLIKADVYLSNTCRKIDVLEGASIKSIFRQAQTFYGHCLGVVRGYNNHKIGWKFAQCGEKLSCKPEFYEIIYK